MQEGVEDIIRSRMNKRTLATILGVKDNEVDRYLPKPVATRLRVVILDELNFFLDFAVAVVEAFDDETVTVNEAFLDQIADQVTESRRATGRRHVGLEPAGRRG